MKDSLQFIPMGLISLVMAFKSLFAGTYLPFHENAAGRSWDEIEKPLQEVILSLLRLGGLGFLTVAVLLMLFPVAEHFIPNVVFRYAVPATAFIFCLGLFANNYILHRKTRAETPWKGSLYALIVIAAGLAISLIG